MQNDSIDPRLKLQHDIRSALSALSVSLAAIELEWQQNPQLVERLIPLSVDKFNQLKTLLEDYHQGQ